MKLPRTANAAPAARPLLRHVLDNPSLGRLLLDGKPLAAVLHASLQFAVTRDGAGTRVLHPQTSAAAGLLRGTAGARVEQALLGMLATADASRGAADIAGITLARNDREFAATSALTALEAGYVPGSGDATSVPSASVMRTAIEFGRGVSRAAYAQAHSWVNLGSLATNQMLRLARQEGPAAPADAFTGSWIASLGTHETGHRVTPAAYRDLVEVDANDEATALSHDNWLEEAGAQILATWGGRTARVADAMGIPSGPELMPGIGAFKLAPYSADDAALTQAVGRIHKADGRIS
ncbi:MAG: hypothetical protein JWO69_1189, partial [Thermoleophilia bacterium]|nr:hypothetical protein [Thermoleophilia bacterium]